MYHEQRILLIVSKRESHAIQLLLSFGLRKCCMVIGIINIVFGTWHVAGRQHETRISHVSPSPRHLLT